MVETLEEANATEDPARREELLTYVFVGGGYAGLEALAELQDFAADAIQRLPARPAAGDALDPRRGRATASCPRSTPTLADYARPRAPRPRHRHPARDAALRRSTPSAVELSTGERIADPHGGLDRRSRRPPEPARR